MREWLATSVAKALPRALEVYLNVHRHPELSDAEQETAALFGAVLEDLHCQVTYGVGGHGVVATLTNGPGRRIMLRAELDALPIEEKTGLPYASTATGYRDGLTVPVMHACGHDAHLAAVLGAVEVLAGARNRWQGTVMVVAQPAEETLSGAAAMVADGLYERFGRPDVALAQHLAVFPAGRVAHGDVVLAASRSLRIHMQGVGGHAADPTSSVNPIEAAADLVIGLRGLVGSPATCSVGSLRAGTAANVVPESAVLEVSLRAPDIPGVRAAEDAVRDLVDATAARFGSRMRTDVSRTASAVPTVNDPGYAAVVRRAHQAALGAGAVLDWRTSMAAEDFPVLCGGDDGVPFVYWMLGSVGPRQWAEAPGADFLAKLAHFAPNHSPYFRPDAVPVLRAGIGAMAAAALACLDDSQVTAGGQPVGDAV